MRASPYDLSGLGYPPVEVETPSGKPEYVAAQRDFAEPGRAAAASGWSTSATGCSPRSRPSPRSAERATPPARSLVRERAGAPGRSASRSHRRPPSFYPRLVSQAAFGDPTPVTSSQPRLTASDESWLNVRTL